MNGSVHSLLRTLDERLGIILPSVHSLCEHSGTMRILDERLMSDIRDSFRAHRVFALANVPRCALTIRKDELQ